MNVFKALDQPCTETDLGPNALLVRDPETCVGQGASILGAGGVATPGFGQGVVVGLRGSWGSRGRVVKCYYIL